MRICETIRRGAVDIDILDIDKNTENYYAVYPIEVGLKIECCEEIFDKIKNEKFIQENFTLNVKILEDNWYSIYFDDKKNEFIKYF